MATISTYLIVSILLGAVLCVTSQVYVDYGNPYDLGEFNVSSRLFSSATPINPPPLHSKAYFPSVEGVYAVMYFITGFGGVAPPALYDDFMHMLASHGYVIFTQWNLLGEDGPEIGADVHLEQLEWLSENTGGRLGDAVASFDHLTLGCNSAGCGSTLRIAINHTDLPMSLLNLEPVSFAIVANDIDFSIPVLNYGTELANLTCAFPGVDFIAWHKKSLCPKILMETADAGHCDILDQESWEVCRNRDFCTVTDDENIWEYKMVVQGITSAFMTAYVQGNMDQLKYITDANEIPWALNQLDIDIDCDY